MALVTRKTEEQKAQEAAAREALRLRQDAAANALFAKTAAQAKADKKPELTEEQKRLARELTEEQKRLARIERARQAFFRTPAGCARLAFKRGDQIFQCEIDVMSQQAIIVPMVGSRTSQKTSDPSEILNSVANEGWELVNGSFVFIEQGQQSRDKFLASGQNVAIKGMTVGYYLFKRCEVKKQPTSNPWES